MADPTPPTLRSSKHSRIMDNLKNSVFNAANSYSCTPLSLSQIAFIEQQLLLAFPAFETPTHPTYTVMIETAFKELNEKYGSTEESISEFIKVNYVGLPWAHNAYLSHHLSRMCKNGEIVCTSRKRYTTPALIEEHSLRSEQPKQRLRRKVKEYMVEEGNLDGGKMVKESGDVIGFQEEDMMVLESGRVKRRRQSCVVFEEDEEVEGGHIVREEHNDYNFSPNLVVNKCNEVGALENEDEDEDDIAWRSRVMCRRRSSEAVEENDEVGVSAVVGGEQNIISSNKNLMIGRHDEEVNLNDVIDLTGEASETSEEWNGIATVSEDHDLVNVPVEQFVVSGLESELLPTECERKTEPKLLVPSSVGALHAKHESEVTTKTMTMNDDNSAAELVVEPVECAEKSSVKDLVLKESEHLIRVGVDELAVKTSALKESDLMIVPFEDNNVINAVSAGINPASVRIDPVIICGLPVEQEQPKRKQLVCYPRKRSKASKKKMKVSSKSLPALAVDRNLFDRCQLHELSSQRDSETKPCETLLESSNFKRLPAGQSQQACTLSWLDGSIDQLDRQNSLNPWHHNSRWEELLSVDDEENLPLQQVLEKCGKRRKHVVQALTENTTPLMTEASSISCLNLPKIKEKQPQQQQQQRKLKPQDQNYSSFEADIVTATESITSPSLHMEEWRNLQRCVDQVPRIGVVDSVEEISDMLHHHQHQGQDKDQGSSLKFELTIETFPSNDGQIWKEKQQTRGVNIVPWEPEQAAKVNTVKLSTTQHLNGQKDELDMGEMVSTAVMEDKVSTLDQNCQKLINQQDSKEETTTTSFILQNQCLWQQEVSSESTRSAKEPSRSAANLIVEETPSKLCQIDKVSSCELATDQLNVCPEVEPSEFVATEHVVSDILQSEQEKRRKQPITQSPLLEPSLQNPKNQIDDQEGKCQIDGRLQAVEATMVTLVEEIVPIKGEETLTKAAETIGRSNWWRRNSDEDQKCEKIKLVEKKLRQRPQKQLESKDVVPSLYEQLQQQKGLSKPATYQNQTQQNEKKRGRGRPRKEERATKVKADLLILQPQIKKRGRPRKQKEEGSAVVISNMHLQQQGLSEPEIDQNSQLQTMQPNNDGPESLLKQVEASNEDELVSSNLDIQMQEVSSESALIPNILHKIELQKQPWIQTDGEDAVVSSNVHLQLQEESYEPSAGHHSQQCTKQMKEENLERPWKQLEAANKDVVVALNLHAYQQGGSFESESGQHSQQGMSPKQREVSEEDTAASSKLHLRKQATYSAPATLGISQQHVSEILQSEVHRTPEIGQAMPPSDNETCQQLKNHKVHVGGQRPKTRAMTASSDNQPDQQQKEWRCHEQEGSQGKFEGQRPKTRAMTKSSDSQPDQQQIVQCSHELERSCGKLEGVQVRKTRAMTTSDNQPVQQQNEWHCHKHEGNIGKFEGDQHPKMRATTAFSDNQPDLQLNERSCQKSPNITVVPLASKDQLRSRVKR